jgi:hypothetical protein
VLEDVGFLLFRPFIGEARETVEFFLVNHMMGGELQAFLKANAVQSRLWTWSLFALRPSPPCSAWPNSRPDFSSPARRPLIKGAIAGLLETAEEAQLT